MLDKLTIITITYNDIEGLDETINSLNKISNTDLSHIIINGGSEITNQSIKTSVNTKIINESDKGRYDAINKGIKLIDTEFFMLIHSGDQLICQHDELLNQLKLMSEENLDLLQKIVHLQKYMQA